MAAPDFSNILASLGNVDAAAENDNPYAPIKRAGDSFAPILMRDVLNPATESNISPGGSILAGLLTGLVSGTGDELGRNYVSHQHDLAQNALHDVFNGNAGSVFSRPDGMGDSVFSSLQNVQAAKQVQDQADAQRLADEITLKQTAGAKAPPEPLDEAGKAMAAKLGVPNAETFQDLEAAIKVGSLQRERYSPEFLAKHGIDESAPPEEVRAILGEQAKNRIPSAALTSIGQGRALAGQVASLGPLIDQMSESPIGDSTLGALMRTVKSASLDTPEGKYQNKLKQLSDQLAANFSHRASWPSIQQQLSALTTHQMGSKDALKGVVANLAATLDGTTQDLASTYGQAGYDALERAKQADAPQQPAEKDTGLPTGAQPTGQTSGGKPVYLVNGKLWVPD